MLKGAQGGLAPPRDTVVPFARTLPAASAASRPLNRDPRAFPFGLLLAESRLFNGLDGFSWFQSEPAAAHYLRDQVWLDLGWAENDVCEARDLYRAALCRTSKLHEPALVALAGQQELLDVVWFGTFDDLWAGRGDFSRLFVTGFREERAAGTIVMRGTEREDFIYYLQRYRSTVPPSVY